MLLLEELMPLRKAKLGSDHPATLISMDYLAGCYWDAGQLEKAQSLFDETLALMNTKLGPDHPSTFKTMNNLASCYEEAKKFDKAEFLHRERLQLVKQKSGSDSPDYLGALRSLGSNMMNQKKWTEAEAFLCDSLTIREKTEADAWKTFNIQSLLGGALMGQKKFADAEPLLLKGYEGMKAREEKIPPQGSIRIPEALERLIELYTNWHAAEPDKGYDAKAAEWQTKLNEHKAALNTEPPPQKL